MKNPAVMRNPPAPSNPGRFAERGLTLIEMMIAILIGLFLTGGLLTLVQAMKRTSLNQSGLSQLQDNERMAMTLITDVIKSTGYYPNPVLNSQAASFPVKNYNANANFTFAGQSLVGTGAYAAGSNVITSRYLTTRRRQRHQLHRQSLGWAWPRPSSIPSVWTAPAICSARSSSTTSRARRSR